MRNLLLRVTVQVAVLKLDYHVKNHRKIICYIIAIKSLPVTALECILKRQRVRVQPPAGKQPVCGGAALRSAAGSSNLHRRATAAENLTSIYRPHT